jgi:hypothetical protein
MPRGTCLRTILRFGNRGSTARYQDLYYNPSYTLLYNSLSKLPVATALSKIIYVSESRDQVIE